MTTRPPQGTVADRIQRLQNFQRFDELTAPRPRSPQIEIPTEGPRSQTGRGRRPEGSFGPPAERTSRDGPDGARRDGRPPVGPLDPQLSPSMNPSATLSPRPATSLVGKPPRHDDPFLVPGGQDNSPRMSRSQEKVVGSNTEVATALSRLRSTVKREKQQQRASATKAYTLAELNDMIDDAIEEHAADVPAMTLGDSSTQASSQPTVIHRSKSERSPRRSIEDVAFDAPPDRGRRPTSPSRRRQMSNILDRNPGQDWLPTRTSQNRARPDPGLRSGSPVKQRTAVFETMHQRPEDTVQACEAPHDPHIHVKSEWSVVPLHENAVEKEKELHNWKFGKTIYDRSEVLSTVSLQDTKRRRNSTESSHETFNSFDTAKASPQKTEILDEDRAVSGGLRKTVDSLNESNASSPKLGTSDEDRSAVSGLRNTVDSLSAAKASAQKTDISDENGTVAGGLPQEHSGKTQMSWLNKWRFFSKGTSIPPRTDEDVAEATAQRDEHYPSSRPSIVKSKVEELLRRDEEEQDRRQSVLERRSRGQSRRPSMVKDSELKQAVPRSSSLKPAQLPPLQVPAEEQAELIGALPETTSSNSSEPKAQGHVKQPDSVEPKAMVRRSWAEEEFPNFSKPRSRAESVRSSMPGKPPSQTPTQQQAEQVATPLDTASTRSSETEAVVAVMERYPVEPKTPNHRSWAEKEVLSFSKPQSRSDSVRGGSPMKATPSTPGHGRSAKMRRSPAPRGSPYTREQSFVLSPAQSPSQSRASSRVRTHRVEVEMRDSPEREARERGETILIVRATNVIEEAED